MCSFGIERVVDNDVADSFVICSPLLPVNAFALPALQTNALASLCSRFVLHQSTGADGHSDFVKVPATVVHLSIVKRHKSFLFSYRIPL